MSWPTCRIGDVFAVARGGSPRPIRDYLTDSPDGLNWIMIGDAVDGSKYITSTKNRIKPEGLKKTRMVREGDFLLTNSMSFGRPYILKTSGCIHDGWLVLSPKSEEISPDFFYHLLGSQILYREFSKRAAGAVVKNLNSTLVRQVQIPLPPLPEQRRIAAILDKADAVRRKRQQTLDLADQFLRSAFLDLFGDPVTNPKGWPVKKLQELIDPERPITYGILKPGPDLPEGVPYVRVVDMADEMIKVHALRQTAHEIAEKYRRSKLQHRDVLLSIRGHVGRLALVPVELVGANITQDTARLAASPAVLPEYLLGVLSTFGLQRWMARHAKGGAVKGINLGDVKKIPIALPPKDYQERFSKTYRAMRDLRALEVTLIDKLEALHGSLTQRAFRGDL